MPNALDLTALLDAIERAFVAFDEQKPSADIIAAQTEARVIAKRVRSQIEALGQGEHGAA